MKKPEDVFSELSEAARDAQAVEALARISEALPAAPPNPLLRQRLLSRAKSPALRWAPHFDKLAALFDLDEPALTAIAERSSLDEHWEPLPLPGVRLFHLQGGPAITGADAGLVSIAEGTHFPHHRHSGEERTLVLEGALREDDGTLYRAGDALTLSAGSAHSFRVLEGAPLIYAVVLFAPIEIDGVRFPPTSP